MRVTALLYHDVVPRYLYQTSGNQGADADTYKLECQVFRRHMQLITAQTGLRPETVTAVDFTKAGRHLLLTFDDGGVSAIEHTACILDEYGWPGHFFVTTGRLGTSGFLNAAQLRILRDGRHLIGSHSETHPLRMGACSAAQLDREWRDSVRRLEDILSEPITTASIPGGYYTRAVVSAAAVAGIRVLFTSEPVTRTRVVDGCLVIGRFSVQKGVSADWVAAVVANHVLPRTSRYLAWNSKKLLKAAGGQVYLKMRKAIFSRLAAADKERPQKPWQ